MSNSLKRTNTSVQNYLLVFTCSFVDQIFHRWFCPSVHTSQYKRPLKQPQLAYMCTWTISETHQPPTPRAMAGDTVHLNCLDCLAHGILSKAEAHVKTTCNCVTMSVHTSSSFYAELIPHTIYSYSVAQIPTTMHNKLYTQSCAGIS